MYILVVQNHQQWLQNFETSVRESSAEDVTSAPASEAGDAQVQKHCLMKQFQYFMNQVSA